MSLLVQTAKTGEAMRRRGAARGRRGSTRHMGPVTRSSFRGDPGFWDTFKDIGRKVIDVGGELVNEIIGGQQTQPPIGSLPTSPPGSPIPSAPMPAPVPSPRTQPGGSIAEDLVGNIVAPLVDARGGRTGLFQPTNGGPAPVPLPPPPPSNGGTITGGPAPSHPVDLGTAENGGEGQREQEIQILQASVLPVVGARTLATAILRGGRAFIAKLAALIRGNPGTVGFLGGMSSSQLVQWVANQDAPRVSCPKGHRPNKTSYFLRDGTFVLEGSTCVKIRRRNPLNPRAADRAIGRVEAGKRAVQRFNRITVRKKKC